MAAPTSTSFKPGHTGNPGGRRKDRQKFADFREEMRALSPLAVQRCREVLENPQSTVAELVPIIKHVHAYGWGNPPNKLEIEAPLADMSDDEIASAITALRTIIAQSTADVGDAGGGVEAPPVGAPIN